MNQTIFTVYFYRVGAHCSTCRSRSPIWRDLSHSRNEGNFLLQNLAIALSVKEQALSAGLLTETDWWHWTNSDANECNKSRADTKQKNKELTGGWAHGTCGRTPKCNSNTRVLCDFQLKRDRENWDTTDATQRNDESKIEALAFRII